jgi:hypothetical protein
MDFLNSKLLVWSGMVSSATIFLGCLLKAFHLQGASFMFVSGTFLFALVFIPLFMRRLFKRNLGVKAIFSGFSGTLMLGALFKVMHWPSANFIIAWSISIILFGIIPVHFIQTFWTEANEDYTPEMKRKDLFLGVLMSAFFSSWYLLIDLSSTPSIYSWPF